MNNKYLVGAIIIGSILIVAEIVIIKNRSSQPLQNPQPTQTIDKAAQNYKMEGIKGNTGSLTLYPQNNSGQTGSATVEERNGKVVVTITLKGEPAGAIEPAHLHPGSCATLGEIKYPLTSVKDGTSETTLNISFADLKKQLPFALNVHKSAQDLKTYVACGDLKLASTDNQKPTAPANLGSPNKQ